MQEIWKDVKGYEGLYQVSNLGRVRSLDRVVKASYNSTMLKKGKILKQQKNENGYLYVFLTKDKKEKNCRVHRLVAEAFIPNPLKLPQVNHKDENKLNNCVENLEWCDGKYNCNYGTCTERRSEKMSEILLNRDDLSKRVIQYTLDGKFVAEYLSTMDVRRKLGFDNGNISKCCNGKQKTYKGYTWRYKQ